MTEAKYSSPSSCFRVATTMRKFGEISRERTCLHVWLFLWIGFLLQFWLRHNRLDMYTLHSCITRVVTINCLAGNTESHECSCYCREWLPDKMKWICGEKDHYNQTGFYYEFSLWQFQSFRVYLFRVYKCTIITLCNYSINLVLSTRRDVLHQVLANMLNSLFYVYITSTYI